MNLRVVHAGLIMMSAALAVFVGVWCLAQYSRDHAAMSVVWAVLSFAVSLGLIAVFAGSMQERLRSSAAWHAGTRWVAGAVLVALGVRLAAGRAR